MKIGNLEIKGPAALAPMAGVTDAAFRRVCARAWSSVTFPATRARYSSRYLETTPPAWAVPRRRWRRSPRRVLT